MTPPRRAAVTGPGGRLGRALVDRSRAEGWDVLPWGRPAYDLDDATAAERLVARDRPEIVLHAAAWTDVDACARDPGLARRRNADAVAEMARACVRHGVSLLVVSTNEIFDGARTDGRGYAELDTPYPANPYGQSKLDGELAAGEAFGSVARPGRAPSLWIVRTAWLFGPPGDDFPSKILAAADRTPPGAELPVVADEIGSPTYAPDLAAAIVRLMAVAPAGTYHLVNDGRASRREWAAEVLARCRRTVPIRAISQREFVRASRPPAWAVLDPGAAAALGVVLRPWREALGDYLVALCPSR